MKNCFGSARPVALILLVSGWAGCSTGPASRDIKTTDAKAFAAPTKLTATLASPIDIDLRWKDNATAEAGYFVEYSPNADKDYVIIEALPPNSTKYRHAHLLPQTRFVFRVRPFFGPVSNTAEITTGKEGPQQDPDPALTNAPPSIPEDAKKSIRTMATFNQAAPTDLQATLIPPAGVILKWKNHAKDADGYLLEIKPAWGSEFKPSSFLETDSQVLVTYGFPFESKFTFRVRPFFYGQPTNLAEQTTGLDPTLGSEPWVQTESSGSMITNAAPK